MSDSLASIRKLRDDAPPHTWTLVAGPNGETLLLAAEADELGGAKAALVLQMDALLLLAARAMSCIMAHRQSGALRVASQQDGPTLDPDAPRIVVAGAHELPGTKPITN